MMIRFTFTTLISLFCCYNVNAQFIKKFNIEVSHGWMKNYNKGEITSGFGPSVEPETIAILTEDILWTRMLSTSLGYNISKNHSVRIGFNNGHVGSILNGRHRSPGFEGSFITNLTNEPNTIRYISYGLNYSFLLPIDSDYFLIEIGASRQKNGFEDTRVFSQGLFVSNYNMELSLGFGHSITDNFDLVSKITLINSFSNNEEYSIMWASTFVPIQIGFEIGFRFRV